MGLTLTRVPPSSNSVWDTMGVFRRVHAESRRMEVSHASNPRRARSNGATLLSWQQSLGSRSYRRGPNSAACSSTV